MPLMSSGRIRTKQDSQTGTVYLHEVNSVPGVPGNGLIYPEVPPVVKRTTIAPIVPVSRSFNLVGLHGTGFIGSLAFPTPSTGQLVGVSGTSQIGTLTVNRSGNISIIGVQGTGFIGTLTESTPSNVNVAITGVEGLGQIGDVLTDNGSHYCAIPVRMVAPTVFQTSDALSNLTDGFASALFSMWIYMPDGDNFVHEFTFTNQNGTNPGVDIKIQNDDQGSPEIAFVARDSSSADIINATYDFTGWSDWVNILISVDTPSQTLQVYANTLVTGNLVETALTATSEVWSSTNLIGNPSGKSWVVQPL